MARKTHHVVPNSDRGGWDVKRGGASKASKHFDTKKRMLNSTDEKLAEIRKLNSSFTVKMAKFSGLIVMEMIRIHQKDRKKVKLLLARFDEV